jgi:hypothetical protein
MSDSTENGPNYGMGTILRGFPNFEDIYQGMSSGYPIALSPYQSGNQGRDAQAKKNYDRLSRALSKQTAYNGPAAQSDGVDGATGPNLLEGVPCTFGANTIFFLPRPSTGSVFTYRFVWRLLTPDTYAETKKPFQLNASGFRYVDQAVQSSNGFYPGDNGVIAGKAAERSLIFTTEDTLRVTASNGTLGPLDPLNGMWRQQAKTLGVQSFPDFGQELTISSPNDGLEATVKLSPLLPFLGYNAEENFTTGATYVFGELGQLPIGGYQASPALPAPEQRAIRAAERRTLTSFATYTTRAKGNELLILVYPNVAPGESTYNFDLNPYAEASLFFGRGGYTNPSQDPLNTPVGVVMIPGWG